MATWQNTHLILTERGKPGLRLDVNIIQLTGYYEIEIVVVKFADKLPAVTRLYSWCITTTNDADTTLGMMTRIRPEL